MQKEIIIKNYLPPFASVLLIILLWQISVMLLDIESWFLPSPVNIITELINSYKILFEHSLITFFEIIVGLVISILISLVISSMIFWFKSFEKTIYPLLITSQIIPVFTLAPILIVWFRLLIAAILIFIFIFFFCRDSFKFSNSNLFNFFLGGLLISIHWYLFFYSIKISSISLTLSILSTASLMTSFLEPLFYKRPFRIHELIFGLIAVVGLFLIFGIESENYFAIFVSLICTLFSVLFSLLLFLLCI